jgi:hypothetical protein
MGVVGLFKSSISIAKSASLVVINVRRRGPIDKQSDSNGLEILLLDDTCVCVIESSI